MSRSARLAVVASLAVAALLPVGAQSSIGSASTGIAPRAWSAVAGADTASVIAMAATLPAGDATVPDAPYCDRNAEIARTLAHDFGESMVDDSRLAGAATQLWGSPVMGTWTLVLARPDATSCIVASGVGYADNVNPAVFYNRAGLTG